MSTATTPPRPIQIDLITAIFRELIKQGFGEANPRQFGAVVKAADEIVAEFGRPHEAPKAVSGLDAWLDGDDTGASSKALARYLAPLAGIHTHVRLSPYSNGEEHPCDPGDFGRCLRLLEAAPELRPHLKEMASVSPVWARLVGAWEELEALYAEERPRGQAPRLYRRMQELREVAPR